LKKTKKNKKDVKSVIIENIGNIMIVDFNFEESLDEKEIQKSLEKIDSTLAND
jgi:hypothetical protein